MRNALILLAVVALIILVAGALNTGVAFDVDYVAGSVSAVSLFWVSVVIAGMVVVAGLGAAWFALAGAAGARRKLETELQSTYERLRQTEREATEAREAADAREAERVEAEARAAETRQVEAAETEAATVVEAPEAATIVAEPEAVTAVAQSEAETETAQAPVEDLGEQTAVTMAPGVVEASADQPDDAHAAADEPTGQPKL